MVLKGRSVPSTNIVDLMNDSLRQRKNFNPDGHLNVPEGIVRFENHFGIVREYKTKGIPEHSPPPLECSKKRGKNAETILLAHING
jgi:hypothetical protein